MKLQGLIILLTFLTVSILGFSSMAHESHASHHSCLFDFSSACAQVSDPINSTLEHLANLQNSIQAAPVQPFTAVLFLVFSAIVAVWFLNKEKLKATQSFQTFKIQPLEHLFEFKTRFLAWLSIFYKRDPLAPQTAR